MVNILKRFINWILNFFLRKRGRKEYKEITRTIEEKPVKESESAIRKDLLEAKEELQHTKEIESEQEDIYCKGEIRPTEEEETKSKKEKTVITEPKSETDIETPSKEEITKSTDDLAKEERKKQITRKPWIKKSPTEQKKKRKEPIRKEKRTHKQKEKEVDLGKTKKTTIRKRTSSAKELSPKTQNESKKPEKPSLSLPHLLSPHIEINFNEAKVFLVLPKQILPIDTSVDISSQN